MAEYNTMEMMIVAAARNLEDGATVGVGQALPARRPCWRRRPMPRSW